MKTLQLRLQALLEQIDPWLDACFPVATTLVCVKQRLLAYSLLSVFVLLRLLQRQAREPWRWIVISLLVINAGLIIQDRDLRPASASDYLIMAASFAAGFQRTRAQWRASLPWLASCIVPLFALSVAAGDGLIQGASSFTGFNINKLGFLAGLLSVLAYGWLREAKRAPSRAAALVLLGLGLGESLLTQSRAALAAPLIVIALDLILQRRWTRRSLLISLALAGCLGSGLVYQWYLKPVPQNTPVQENVLSDLNRARTIECWFSVTSSSHTGFWLGLGYGSPARERCGPEAIPSLTTMEKSRGLQHAHNLYAQVFSESGIGGLLLLLGLTWAGFRRAWRQRRSNQLLFTLPLFTFLFLMALGITYWQVLLVNQVLVGYSLAGLSAVDPARDAADAATPATQQP